MMEKEQIKLECIKLAHTGSPEATLKIAEQYYDWIVECENQDVPDKPKRKRRTKAEMEAEKEGGQQPLFF